jgi:hypothetical protein
MELDDLELGHASEKVDEFLLSFCLENKFPALMATAIILARLLHLNKMAGSHEDYSKLLLSVHDGIDKKEFDKPTNIH